MYSTIITIIAGVCALFAMGLFVKAGFLRKILVKLGVAEQRGKVNWTAFSWETCLKKMDCRADVVFFGDSIVQGGNFHLAFPEYKIVNLGLGGDTLSGMCGRVSTVQALQPQKVFCLGGINGLTDWNGKMSLKTYRRLLTQLREKLPFAEIYVHSLFPVTKSRERGLCKNSTILWFNREVEKMAKEMGINYIDIHSRYVMEGVMNPAYCQKDGLHIANAGYALWYEELKAYLPTIAEKN